MSYLNCANGLSFTDQLTEAERLYNLAEELSARVALLYGDEWPQVKIKNMATAEQELAPQDRLFAHLQAQVSLSS